MGKKHMEKKIQKPILLQENQIVLLRLLIKKNVSK